MRPHPALFLSLLVAAGAWAAQGAKAKGATPPVESPKGEATPTPEATPADGGTDEGGPGKKPEGTVSLNGVIWKVRWSDGDTFRFLEGPYKDKSARLQRYNALESYGPVHRWGQWTAAELWKLSKGIGKVAAKTQWTCTTGGQEDSYHRILVDCPDLAAQMLRDGLGMAFSIDGPAPEEDMKWQREAMAARRGMWEKGVPSVLLTSLHSLDEHPGAKETYNRAQDPQTGAAPGSSHTETYAPCQWVCSGPPESASCMLYVPFERRYRKRPECLPDPPKDW